MIILTQRGFPFAEVAVNKMASGFEASGGKSNRANRQAANDRKKKPIVELPLADFLPFSERRERERRARIASQFYDSRIADIWLR